MRLVDIVRARLDEGRTIDDASVRKLVEYIDELEKVVACDDHTLGYHINGVWKCQKCGGQP